MLASGAPALNRDEALEFFEQLKSALIELGKVRGHGGGSVSGVNIEHSFVASTEQVYGRGGRSLTQPT
jgi:hypothetical protein